MHPPNQRRASWLSLSVILRLQLLLIFALLHSARADVNITLADTASQITYSPPACGLTLSSAGTGNCNSSWRIVTSNTSSSGTLTTSSGPNDVGGGGLIPQLFLTVRALALSIRTSHESTAIINISVSTNTPVVSVTSQINSSIQPIEVIGLVEDRLTTLALTFDPSPSHTTILSIDSIVVTVSDQNTAPFVSPSVPASVSLPTVSPSIVIPSSSSSHHGQKSGDIAAEALGAILGTVLLASGAGIVLLFCRRRKRRLARPDSSHSQDPPEQS